MTFGTTFGTDHISSNEGSGEPKSMQVVEYPDTNTTWI